MSALCLNKPTFKLSPIFSLISWRQILRQRLLYIHSLDSRRSENIQKIIKHLDPQTGLQDTSINTPMV